MPHNVHDAFFKWSFAHPEHAAGELRSVLPPALAARIDFSTLTPEAGSFVDETLQDRHSDLLFSARIARRSALLYLLFEHQRRVPPLMAFHLLRYLVRIWDDWLKKHPRARRLPAIVAVVLHHSKKGWTAPVAFEDLIDLDPVTRTILGDQLPRFRFLLDDLSEQADEAIKQRVMSALGRLVLWCLKNGRDYPERILSDLGRWADLVREVYQAPHGAAALQAIFRYILEASGRPIAKRLGAAVAQTLGKDVEEQVLTAADRLRREGRREGVQEGQRTILLQLLRARFGPLPKTARARIEAAEPKQLTRWARRVLTALTLHDVLDGG